MDGGGIYTDFEPFQKSSIGRGYIIISPQYERSAFVARCLRLEKFSVQTEDGGGILHDCFITKSALRDVYFPKEGEILGCAVVFFFDLPSHKAIIVGVVDKADESGLDSEDIIAFRKDSAGNHTLISLSADGAINVSVIATAGKGEMNVNVTNSDSTAKLNLNVKGSINIYVEGTTTLNQINGDVTLNVKENINLNPRKLKIGKANEAMALADTLQTEINKTNDVVKVVVDALKNWPAIGGDGAASLKTYFESKIIGKDVGSFDKIKSGQSFLE